MRYVTVIVRLVVDERRLLSHGEIIDQAGDVISRFATWEAAISGLRAAVADEGEDQKP
jgi:hypothetical protein